MGDHAAHGREDLSSPDAGGGGNFDAEELERARRLFAQECRFVAGAAAATQVPPTRLPEVAFAGRSNVGKSSLVNALTGRKTLAKISDTPGRTRQLNFFVLADRLMLVDLPGYGYAQASKSMVGAWTRLVDLYLGGRATLRRTLLLIDARHGLKDIDRQTMAKLDRAAVSYQCVLTKCDKLTGAELALCREAIAEALARHPAAHPRILATSALAASGLAELRAEVARLADWSAQVD